MLSGRRALLTVAVAGLLAAQAPLRGEWLVGKDGSKFEIRGPWTVKGKLVTFTLPNGTLGSLRLSELDLEASQAASAAQATADATAAAAPAAAAKKPPVMVITDKDVAHGTDEAAQAPAAADAAAAAPAGRVQISSWDKSYSIEDGGVAVTGTVRNGSPDVASQLAVTVKLYDEDGALVASSPASLSTETLNPNGSASFRCLFTGVATFAAAKFDISSVPLKTKQEGGAEAAPTAENPPPAQ
jgi:hypothetical protein